MGLIVLLVVLCGYIAAEIIPNGAWICYDCKTKTCEDYGYYTKNQTNMSCELFEFYDLPVIDGEISLEIGTGLSCYECEEIWDKKIEEKAKMK